MAFCGVSISSSTHPPPSHISHYLPSPRKPTRHLSSDGKWSQSLTLSLGRRTLIFGCLALLDLPFSKLLHASEALASEFQELVRYIDSEQGFTLLVPSSWIKVDKAGATVLFEDPDRKVNNVGVVVNPTRISSLGEFGNPEFVAEKLIQAERRKESTKEAEVISVSERSGHNGIQVYEFEYRVDSTRGGLKRVFSAAFVASKKLYLLNITHSDGLENPLDIERRMMLEQVLHSFDVVAST